MNTSLTNKLVHEALEQKKIPELKEFNHIKPEQKIFDSRMDFYLEKDNGDIAYVEVKNVTLLGEDRIALFPDAVSTRGQKHLKDLIKIKQAGHRAVMFYVINREDVDTFAPAAEIDPTYAKLLKDAKSAGVEILAYQSVLTPKEVKLTKKIKVNI